MILIIDSRKFGEITLWLYQKDLYSAGKLQHFPNQNLLNAIKSFLKSNKTEYKQIKFIGIVEDNSSFTALRNAANIANIFALYQDAKIFGLKEKENQPQIIKAKIQGSTQRFYSPNYSSAPRITRAKRQISS